MFLTFGCTSLEQINEHLKSQNFLGFCDDVSEFFWVRAIEFLIIHLCSSHLSLSTE